MFSRLAHHTRHNVVAYLALFVALGGVSYAVIPSSDGTINGCYSNSKGTLRVIDAGAGATCASGETAISWKTGTNPAGGDLTGNYPNPEIGAAKVGSPELAPGSVGTNKLAANAVTSGKVANDSLTGNDILESSLGKVGDADTLDGKDSTAFGAPNTAVHATQTSFTPLSPGTHTVVARASNLTAGRWALVAKTTVEGGEGYAECYLSVGTNGLDRAGVRLTSNEESDNLSLMGVATFGTTQDVTMTCVTPDLDRASAIDSDIVAIRAE